MQRRDFIQISALSVAGLLTVHPGSRATAVPTRIGILAGASLVPETNKLRITESVVGAATMLRESGLPYDLVHRDADFSSYKVLVLPDEVLFNFSLREKVETYLLRGGAILASFRSGLRPDGSQFATPAFGIERVGPARYSPDFIATDGSVLGRGLASTELVMYLRGLEVVSTGATILANTIPPWEGANRYPAATESEKVIYFMHPLFTQYHRSAPRWCRQLFLNALDRLAPGIVDGKTNNAKPEISL